MRHIGAGELWSAWPGYPAAVAAGGFGFVSATLGVGAEGHLLGGWSELPSGTPGLASGFGLVDAVEGAAGAQASAAFARLRDLLAALGGDFTDLLRVHFYQREKRLFPVFERVRLAYEPREPAPASGIGVSAVSPGGAAWFAIDGIAIDRSQWGRDQRRGTLPATQPSGSHYSQAVAVGPYVFVAGLIPQDAARPGAPMVRGFDDVPEAGRFLRVGRSHPDTRDGPIAAQTWFTYERLRGILEAAGSRLEDVVNLTVYLQDMRDFATFHRVHERCFPGAVPALTVTEAREVGHQGSLIEIEATAMRPGAGWGRRRIELPGGARAAHCATAVLAGPLAFLSGQVGQDAGGRVVTEVSALPARVRPEAAAIARVTGRPEATSQAFAIFERLGGILAGAGAGLPSLARLMVYLEDFRDLVAFDLACRSYLPGPRPSLSCVAVPRVSPLEAARLCVETIAVIT